MTSQRPNPYDELAALADPEPDFGAERDAGRDDFADLTGAVSSDREREEWSPPRHRSHRGRSRLAGVPVVLKLGATALVGAVLLVAGDRLAVAYAEQKTEESIQQSLHLAARPQVDIDGFPFLTQVLDKRIDRARVTVPDVAASKVSLAEVQATAQNIHVVGDLPSSVQGAVIDRMDGGVLLSFDDLSRELGASQLKFSKAGKREVLITGTLPVAGRELRLQARATVGAQGGRSLSTTIAGMRLDVPGLFTYRPGEGPEAGLRLHPAAARRISSTAAEAKALLGVPALTRRLGLPKSAVDRALHGEEELHRLTGSPRFLQQLSQVNLVDLVVEHPWLLEKAGIDPGLVDALLKLRPPALTDRLSFSYALPESARDIRVRDVSVEESGIRARLVGTGLAFGSTE
ncbi:LmeA family phospholipid-binding protein [Streptomyces lichenis]|uniref:DUF2993 domain-containing protein n=1 Tax=Streptomyces lichenis TaxID=2306967 RepID=A0ABT0IBT4_9ACTN|nr:DUF2993 domain-containing protein [Streptomyces lichenis]MCK8678787.1 DUF2993 domain-containing protein [Streptomyces lichenis]